MSLESIPAHAFITYFFPRMSVEDLNSLGLVNKGFFALISRVQVTYYLGRPANVTPIEDATIRMLRVLAAAQLVPKIQSSPPESIMIQANFEECVNALGIFQPQNAVQLKNRYKIVWHLNYNCPTERIIPVQTLKDTVMNSHAEIGKFSIHRDGTKIDFKVSAVAYLSGTGNDDVLFSFAGNTRIYIHPAKEPLPAKMEDRRKLHGLSVINTTRQLDGRWTNEQNLDYNKKMDLREQWFDIELEFRDVLRIPQGSNREIDQKIIQVMVEIFQQNESKSQLKVESRYTDYAILAMGGLVDNGSEEMINEVIRFRHSNDHILFPPHRDYTSHTLIFNREQLSQKNVRLSRDQGIEPESWLEIVQRQPILHHEGGLIPDYWTTKPVGALAKIES